MPYVVTLFHQKDVVAGRRLVGSFAGSKIKPMEPFIFPSVKSDMFDVRQKAFAVDAEDLLTQYWGTMSKGVLFEKHVHSEANRSDPNVITLENVTNANRISGRISAASLEGLIGMHLKNLAAIPENADMFESRDHEMAARRIFCDLCVRRGMGAAKATKILYQKRPNLFPILDSYARLAIDLPWIGDTGRDDYDQVLRIGFVQLRAIRDFHYNKRVLDELHELSPTICDGVQLSRVRIVDILAWMAVGQGLGVAI